MLDDGKHYGEIFFFNLLLIKQTTAHSERLKCMAFVHSTGEWKRANQANTSPFIGFSHTEYKIEVPSVAA